MELSTFELIRARELAVTLLDELQLAAYLFEVEPEDGQWRVRVECALENGWESLSLNLPRDILLDERRHGELRLLWRERLAACKVEPPR